MSANHGPTPAAYALHAKAFTYICGMGAEQRHFARVLATRFRHLDLNLNQPAAMPGMLVDISVGGMKILLEQLPAEVSLQPGTTVAGHIESENPTFRMDFTATVAWQRPADATAVAIGLRFADYVPLPEPLMNLLEIYDAV